mmetsp:Transcript_7805/g.15733  ORF Transcript_7805/g.15733 Transcript_7805/m.15733 type:complete len:86 (-) Transcript_7805:620-877(-)
MVDPAIVSPLKPLRPHVELMSSSKLVKELVAHFVPVALASNVRLTKRGGSVSSVSSVAEKVQEALRAVREPNAESQGSLTTCART